MSFMIGQSVIHPAHGAGKVIAFQEKELVKGFQRYCVIEFARNRLTVHLPERRIKQIGVRPVISASRIAGVISTLELPPLDLPDEFRMRRSEIAEQIHSGFPKQIAAAVRDLMWRSSAKYLTEADKEALAEGRTMLITEIALALNEDKARAKQRVDDAIDSAIRTRQELEVAALEAEALEAEEPEPVPDWPMPVPAGWRELQV